MHRQVVRVKARLQDDVRRFDLERGAGWGGLQAKLRTCFGAAPLRVCYRDDEGDVCSLTNDAELQAACACVAHPTSRNCTGLERR